MSGFSRVNVPVDSRARVSCSHSSSDPVHQWMSSGWVSSAISLTQLRMPSWVVGACVVAVMPGFPSRAFRGGPRVETHRPPSVSTGQSWSQICDRPASLLRRCLVVQGGYRRPMGPPYWIDQARCDPDHTDLISAIRPRSAILNGSSTAYAEADGRL